MTDVSPYYRSAVQAKLTKAHTRDDLAHRAIQVLQHAEVVRFVLGLLKQLLAHTWQLGVCDVGAERLRVRQDDCIRTDDEIRTIFRILMLRSAHQPMMNCRGARP